MKNILIIGASKGIGKASAELLSLNNDYKVYGTFCKTEPDTGSNIEFHYLEVLDTLPVIDFLPEKLDGLVYCPGAINLKPFSRIKPEDFRADFDLQVVGAIKIIQLVLPRLKASQNASIILFSTVAVQMGFNFHSMVSASKGALEGLTKALSAELAPGIRVNCIAPSITNTALAAQFLNTEEKMEANKQRHALKKIGEPMDIANLVEFLVSDKSGWITGQIMHVDGGISVVK